MEVQASNRQYIEQLKDWQAEAFVYVVLFCCVNESGGIRSGWNLSKICALYDLVGDIFSLNFVKAVCHKLHVHRFGFEYYELLKTNIRLLPKEAHTELYNICSIILEKSGTVEDQKIGAILLEEIAG